MRNKRKILLPVGLIAFALVCIFGGQALVQRDNERRLAELKAQNSVAPKATPSAAPENVVYTLPPVVTYTLPPAAAGSSAPAVDEVKTDEDGNIIITPGFENEGNGAIEVVEPGVQVTANVGGGGGEMPTESDGAYHGEAQPSATPKPTQTPPPAATPQPTATPKPTQTTPPATSPAATPEPDNGNGGPPNRKGSYDGEISPDGKYEWWEMGNNSQWVDRNTPNGGTGGQIDDSDQGWGWGEGGETVGSFG